MRDELWTDHLYNLTLCAPIQLAISDFYTQKGKIFEKKAPYEWLRLNGKSGGWRWCKNVVWLEPVFWEDCEVFGSCTQAPSYLEQAINTCSTGAVNMCHVNSRRTLSAGIKRVQKTFRSQVSNECKKASFACFIRVQRRGRLEVVYQCLLVGCSLLRGLWRFSIMHKGSFLPSTCH